MDKVGNLRLPHHVPLESMTQNAVARRSGTPEMATTIALNLPAMPKSRPCRCRRAWVCRAFHKPRYFSCDGFSDEVLAESVRATSRSVGSSKPIMFGLSAPVILLRAFS